MPAIVHDPVFIVTVSALVFSLLGYALAVSNIGAAMYPKKPSGPTGGGEPAEKPNEDAA